MNIIDTEIDGVKIIEPRIFNDDRGYFYESYNKREWSKSGLEFDFVQDNQSKSSRGVVRGLHYQLAPHAQTKLVRVLEGEVFDVVVDLRKNSDSFGQWFGVILSLENHKQLLIPRGFAHGFSTLSETAVLSYKCDNFYNAESERGIIYNDEELGIDWKLEGVELALSEKDLAYPPFELSEHNF